MDLPEKYRIKVEYNGKPSEAMDWMIYDAMKGVGCKWYAQGYDYTADIRDICFDYYPKEQMKYKENHGPTRTT
uniref:Uncharacterized protein n=1 Tax=viral metagenome TaxID=1070528 RepID=A0A6H1ZRP2_9ZZZZ